MVDDEEKIKFLRPADDVTQFLKEHPTADALTSLHFLLDYYPQRRDGEIQWLLDGGTVVHLLHPDVRPQGHDLDMITKNSSISRPFVNSRYFDAKPIDIWCKAKGIALTDEVVQKVFGSPEEVSVEGRAVLTVPLDVLAASKLLPYFGQESRVKDLSDIQLLGLPEGRIQEIVHQLQQG